MIQPWPRQRSEPVADCRIFTVRKDTVVNPRTGRAHDMFVLDQPNWVNVIPLTDDDHVVMIEQWRHGTRSVHLETPGGLMDPGETPEACARRELREETGYEAGDLKLLGVTHPNPALQNNHQYYVLARHCRRVGPPQLDHAEDIHVRLIPRTDLPRLIREGQITHGIVIAGFYFLNHSAPTPSSAHRRQGLP